MLKFILHGEDRVIVALGLEDFAEKYRRGSFRPEKTMEDFMKACARRAGEHGIHLSSVSVFEFVLSLIASGLVTLETRGLSI